MPGPVEVSAVHAPGRFLQLQRAFYRGDPHYVPPMSVDRWQVDPRKNPFFERAEGNFLVATRHGQPVGRVSAVRNLVHDEFHGDRVGFFGHFEASDEAAAHALLDAASIWLRERGATALRGPIDLSTNYRCGLLIGGEPGPPVLMMPYNPEAYRGYLESYGLAKTKDLLALMLRRSEGTPDRFYRLVERIRKRTGATIRPFDMKRLDEELAIVWQLYNRIWERNWGFVPFSEGEFLRSAKELKQFAIPELLVIVEMAGEPIAFALCVPDVNVAIQACGGRLFPFGWWKFLATLKHIHRCRVVTLGVQSEHRKIGIDALLLHYFYVTAPPIGYPDCEASWILEDNHEMVRVLQSLGGREYRRYRVFEKAL